MHLHPAHNFLPLASHRSICLVNQCNGKLVSLQLSFAAALSVHFGFRFLWQVWSFFSGQQILSFKLDLGAGKLTRRIGRCFSFGSNFISVSPVLAFQFPEIKPTHSYSAVRLLGTFLHHDEGEGLGMVPSILSKHLRRFLFDKSCSGNKYYEYQYSIEEKALYFLYNYCSVHLVIFLQLLITEIFMNM